MNQYTELIIFLKELAESNPLVTTVTKGDPSKIDLEKSNIYPLVHIDIAEAGFTNGQTLTFNVTIQALTERDLSPEVVSDKFWRQDNEVDNHNETLAILNAMWTTVYRNWNENDMTTTEGVSLDKIEFEKGNILDGWSMSFQVEVPNKDLCLAGKTPEPTIYDLTLIAGEGGTVLPYKGTEEQVNNSYVAVYATANEGYEFDKWVIDGVEDSNALTNIFMSKDKVAEAFFAFVIKNFYQWLPLGLDDDIENKGTGLAPLNGNIISGSMATQDIVLDWIVGDAAQQALADFYGIPNPISYAQMINLNLYQNNDSAFLVSSDYIASALGSKLIAYWEMNDANTPLLDFTGNSNADVFNTLTYQQPTGFDKQQYCLYSQEDGAIRWYINNMVSDFDPNEFYFSVWLNPDDIFELQKQSKYIFRYKVDASNEVYLRVSSGKFQFIHIGNGVVNSMSVLVPLTNKWLNVGIGATLIDGKMVIAFNGVKYIEKTVTLDAITGSATAYGILSSGYNAPVNYWFYGQIMRGIMCNAIPTTTELLGTQKPRGVVNCAGDSRTEAGSWLTRIVNHFTSNIVTWGNVGIINDGISGNSIAQLAARSTETNANQITDYNVIVVWIGVNSSGQTVQALFDQIKDYCTNAKASGWEKVVLCTEIDATGGSTTVNGWSTKYLELNNMLRADDSFYDELADLGNRVELQDSTNLAYFTDGTHLTEEGYSVVADVVSEAISNIDFVAVPSSDFGLDLANGVITNWRTIQQNT